MTSEEFVRAVKMQTSDAAARGTLQILKRPPGRKPSERLLRLSEWYKALNRLLKIQLPLAADSALHVFKGSARK